MGKVVLVLYVFVCMFCQFFLYSWGSEYGKLAYDHFKDEFESEVLYLTWALESKQGAVAGGITGFLAALMVAVLTFLVLKLCPKTPTVGILTLLVYLIVYVSTSYSFNPYMIANTTDFGVAMVYGSLGCLSAILFTRRKNKRRELKFRSSIELWKLRLELEHSSLKEQLHLSAWMFVFALVGIVFVGTNEFFFNLPPEIANYYAYQITLFFFFLFFLLAAIGFFVGIIIQLIQEIENVTRSVGE